MDSYARRHLDARGSNQTAELLQANDSYITVPSYLAMCVAERRNKMKSPFRIRVQGPSGEFEVFEDDPTKVVEKVASLKNSMVEQRRLWMPTENRWTKLGSVGIEPLPGMTRRADLRHPAYRQRSGG
jgi:hypothetical protein